MQDDMTACIQCGRETPIPHAFCSDECADTYPKGLKECKYCSEPYWRGEPNCFCRNWPCLKLQKRKGLQHRFPDYYEYHEHYDAGDLVHDNRYLRGEVNTPKQKKRSILKRIAKGEIFRDDLPF